MGERANARAINGSPAEVVGHSRRSRTKLLIAGGILGLGVMVGSCSGNSVPSAYPASSSFPSGGTVSSYSPATTSPMATPSTQAPAPTPALTVGQMNAIESAQSYLGYSAFSRSGLIEQLQYEKFSAADAKYAVDHVTVDWTEQADKSAKSYMDYSSFSSGELIEQLEYEGFTSAQAKHGAASVGL